MENPENDDAGYEGIKKGGEKDSLLD